MVYGRSVVSVVYRLIEVVDTETGHWCPACALPSAVKLTLASIIVIGGVEQPMRLSTGLRCDDGHGWLPADGQG